MVRRTVLITGATGFVGRQVLSRLVTRGTEVRAIVRAGSRERLQHREVLSRIIETPDLFGERQEWWAEVCQGVDTIVHVAWFASPAVYLTSPKNSDCLIGTLELAKGASRAGVRRIVGVGTCFEYDLSRCVLSEATPLRPLTPYAGAKAAAFIALSQALPPAGISFAWCRLFYLYGEGEDERRLVAYLRSRLQKGETAELTNGRQIRDFLDVEVAGTLIADVALDETQGPINICSGEPVTVRQMAERIADECGGRDLLRFGARPDNIVDPPCVVGVRSEALMKIGILQ